MFSLKTMTGPWEASCSAQSLPVHWNTVPRNIGRHEQLSTPLADRSWWPLAEVLPKQYLLETKAYFLFSTLEKLQLVGLKPENHTLWHNKNWLFTSSHYLSEAQCNLSSILSLVNHLLAETTTGQALIAFSSYQQEATLFLGGFQTVY